MLNILLCNLCHGLRGVENIVIKVEVETLTVELTTRPKAELLMTIKAEAEGRSLNARLTSQPRP